MATEARVTNVGVYVEEAVNAIYATNVGVYVEEAVNAIYATNVGVYVEEYVPPADLLRILGANKRSTKSMKHGNKQ